MTNQQTATGAGFRCVIVGQGSLPRQCAELLRSRGNVICGIVSADPDLIRWARDQEIAHSDAGPTCQELRRYQPFDYLFSIVNPHVLEPDVLTLPARCAINYHDGPLPRYGGVHATSWAILNRERTHGVTWHVMAERVDAGEILAQPIFAVAERETAVTLNAKCYAAAIEAFRALVEELQSGTEVRRPQDPSHRTYFRLYRRPPAACVLSWQQTAEEIGAFVRGLDFGRYPNPLGAAKWLVGSDFVIVKSVDVLPCGPVAPSGTVTGITPDAIRVAAASGEVALRSMTTVEGRPITPTELIERYSIAVGQQMPTVPPELSSRLTTCYDRAARSERFWIRRLSGLRPPEFPYVDVQASPGQAVYCRVDLPVGSAVRTLAQIAPTGVTYTDMLTAAFYVYVQRLMRCTTFTLGYSDGDLQDEVRGVDGIFAAHWPITLDADRNTRFEAVVAALRGEREAVKRHALCARDIVTRYPELIRSSANLDLPVHVVVSGSAFCAPPKGCILALEIDGRDGNVRWHYDRTRLSDEALARITEQFSTCVAALLTDPNAQIGALPLLSARERRKIVTEWNDTVTIYPRDRCLHQLFEEQVQRTPDAIAVVFEDQKLTYAQLNARANQLAHCLREHGVGPEALVGLCLDRTLDMLVGVLGILKAGGAYVPLDPDYPPERLAFMLADACLSLVVTQTQVRSHLPDSNARFLCLDEEALLATRSGQNLLCGAVADNLAYLIYTSGSTGRPKGTQITHANVTRLMAATQHWFHFDERDVWTLFHSLAFDFSVWELWGPLLYGGTLVVVPYWVSRSPDDFVELLHRQKVTVLNQTPSAFGQLLQRIPSPGSGKDLAIRVVIFGGEALEPASLQRWYALYGPEDRRLINMYGITETTVHVTYREMGFEDIALGRGSQIGGRIADLRIYLLGAWLQPVPVGVVGEIYVGGAGVSRGYLGRAELTAERFVPDPFSGESGARLYRSGDLARYLPDGNLEYLGRADDQVKIRGFRIELGEIESALLSCAGIQQAMVLAREDNPGDKRLVAYVVGSASETAPSVSKLREHLVQKLPEYMVPSAWVVLEQLPLTPNGKLDRQALPAPGPQGQDEGYVAARTPIEEGLAQIWREVLRLEQVGVHTSFFALGGHSLLGTQVISRIRSIFAVELPLSALFEAPTIAGLAERIGACGGAEGSGVAPLVRVSREGRLPLSFAQQRLWFIDQLEPQSSLYNVPSTLRLVGPLDVAALQQSLQEIVARHEALRTTFAVVEGEPFQVIHEAVAVALPVVDLSTVAGEERERAAQRLITEEAQRPFDLCVGPVFRFGLLRLGDVEHVLLLTLHHIVSDGWSQEVLTRELSTLYNAFRQGLPSPLPALPIQYADYALWQRNWLQGEVLERQISYWKEHLEGAPALLELPTDRPRPSVQTFRGAIKEWKLATELTDGLKALGQREGATLFMTLLAAFQTLLFRYSGQADFVVGTPIANRTQSEVEGLIGFFVNSLALRADLSGNPTFQELLGRVRAAALGAYAHQDLPFEKLVEELQPQRSLSHTPVFQVLFSLANAPGAGLGLEGVEIEGVVSDGVSAKFDLSLILSETSGNLGGVLEYNRDLFDADRIARMLRHLEALLVGIVAEPEQKVYGLPMLSEVERGKLVVEWNATTVEYPRDRCVHELFEEQVERTPEAVAVAFGQERLTYRQLNARANQLAHYLQNLGVASEVLVGVCVQRSIEMVVGVLGILKAGGAYVPIDPANPLERLRTILEEAQPALLLCDASSAKRLHGLPGRILNLDPDALHCSDHAADNLVCVTSAQDLAYVMYTSGSTGQPKGVAVPHRAITRLVRGANYCALGPDEVILQFAPLAFDASTFEIWGTLLNGGRLVLVEGPTPSLEELGDTIRQEGVTTLWLTAGLFHAMVESNLESLQGVRQLLAGGDVLSVAAVSEALQGLAGCRLINGYGPTENTTFTCCHAMATGSQVRGSIPIGRPISNTRVYVLDTRMQLVPQGVAGELYAGGDGLARGYVKRAALTAEKFVPDPFSDVAGARLYRTGDLARYLLDGTVEFVGRLDHQVKIRGFRIELGEIESVLLSHAQVREAVVVAREEGVGEKRLVGYVVGHAGWMCLSELREHLVQKLPEYMVPSAWVVLEQLPLTPNGKLDRQALPAPGPQGQDEGYVAARTPIEEGLAQIWREVLRLEQVGVHTSFFALGGHSLLGTQVISRIRSIFAVELPLSALFEAPTIAGLAERIGACGGAEGSGVAPLVRVSREGRLPLSFAQQRLWFIDQLEPQSSLYNVPSTLRLVGPLDVAALQQSLQEIVARHEALRTTFAVVEGEPFQVIHEAVAVALPVVDLSTVAGEERERAAQRLITEEAQRPFDLCVGPVFRFGLLRLGDVEHVLLLTLHHIVSDGWSQEVLTRELSTLYNAFRQGLPSPLPALPIQYADYALWQRNWLQAEPLQRQIGYWKAQMAGAPPVLNLPTDRPAEKTRRYSGRCERLLIAGEHSHSLHEFGRQERVTQFMILLAVFDVLLYRYTNQTDLVVGTDIANRNHADTERLIGFFLNHLVLRTDLSGNPTFRELLQRVREVCLDAYAHQDLPFDTLVEVLRPERSTSHTPLFQVLFVMNPPAPNFTFDTSLSVSSVNVGVPTSKYDLGLFVSEGTSGLSTSWVYQTDLFDAQTIRGMAADFEALVGCVASAPDTPLAQLEVLLLNLARRRLSSECAARRRAPHAGVEEIVQTEQTHATERNEGAREAYELSPQQRFVWRLQQQQPVHNAQITLHVCGSVDEASLNQALREVCQRHEALRTLFPRVVGRKVPLQTLTDLPDPTWCSHDLRDLTAQEQHSQLSQLAQAHRLTPFDLQQAPLLRGLLIHLDTNSHLLLLTLPALCLDRRSLRNLAEELALLYAGRATELAQQEPLQYADYAQWQNDLLVSQDPHARTARSFWSKQIQATRESAPLTLGRGLAETGAFSPALLALDLEPSLLAAVEALAQQLEMSCGVVLETVWAVLLSRWTGISSLTLGHGCDGRSYAELENGLGLFTKTLPIPLQVELSSPLRPLLFRADIAMRDATGWEEYYNPESGGLEEELAYRFEYEDWSERAVCSALSLVDVQAYSTPFSVGLGCRRVSGGLRVEWGYDAHRYSEEAIRHLATCYAALLRSAVQSPDAPVGSLNLLAQSERDALLVRWNATEADYSRYGCVHELFEEQVQRTPQAVAVVYEEEQLTYAELNRRANRLAHYLQTLGVGPDVRVGLCLERSVDLIVGLLGILKAGGAYVPLDPALPQERRTWMLNDSGAKVLLTHQALVEVADASTVCVCVDRDAHQISRHSEHNPPREVQAHHLVYVIYTSGSTGRPKGVGVEHRHLLNYVLGVSERLGLKAAASYASVSTLAADLGNTMVFPSLCLGGCLHLISSERAMDAVRFGEYLCSHRIDYLKIVPSHLWALLGEGAQVSQQLPREVLVLGGEASSWELVAKIREACPGLRVFNHYGPTETTVGVLTHAVELAESSETTPSLTVPLGRPLPNTQVYVLNAYLQPVPVGVVGELYIGGAGVSRGYLGHEELTQERFVSDRFSGEAGARLYRTGDLCRYLSDGNVEFVGRVDHQVKIRGFRIELGEIESVLLSHPEVREAVVEAREDVGGDRRLVGYVVGQTGSVSVSALRAYLGEKLPEYMVPSAWVVLEQLPLTSNGKVDRNALAAPESAGQEEDYVGARTPVEEGLAQIWGEVLRVDEVGVHTSFFALGGHSLLATQVISRIRSIFAVELPLRALFEAPTIAGLAERIGASGGEEGFGALAMVRVSREGRLPLSFAQQRLWLIDQLEPGSRFYTNPYGFRLTGRLNFRALQDSLTEICIRHEVLRSSYPSIEGEPVQRVSQDGSAPLSFLDLSDMPELEREGAVKRLISDSGNLRFDLAEGPLFRTQLVQLAPEDYLLLLVIHHIVWDGQSTDVLLHELSVLYDAFSVNRPSPLAELAIQYTDYAAWQRKWVQGKVTETQLSYWRTQLRGAAFGLPIRTDRSESAAPTFEGGLQPFSCAAAIANSLEALAQRERASLYMVLFAAFNVLLYQDSRQEDICIGTPVSGRRWTETEGLIGLFLNTLVIRMNLSGNPSFRGLVGRVRDTVLAAHAHQDLPFEQVVDALKPQRDLSHTPLFRVWFTFGESSAPVVECNGLSIQSISAVVPLARYAIRMNISHVSDGLQGSLIYQTDLFEVETIQRLTRKMEVLLSAVASDADLALGQIAERLTEVDGQSLEEHEQYLDEENRQRLGRRTRTAIRG